MRRLASSLFCAATLVAVASHSSVAAAQSPQVTAQISESEVEVGEAFSVQLKAMTESGPIPSDPDLRAPSGFSMSGPMISTQSYMSFGSGGRKVLQGIGATWTLVGSATGTFTIPAPTVEWNGKRLRATPLTVKVVPQGTKPQRQPGGFLFPGGNPFASPFGNNWPFGSMTDDDDDAPPDDTQLTLPRAPSNDVFLHSIPDKTRVVVGEQVVIKTYRYRTRTGFADIEESKPMRLQDFLRVPLTESGSQAVTVARAGGRRFFVRLLEKVAAFPLKTGTLTTGSYTERYVAYNRRTRFSRASEDIRIQVVEPPAERRPVGYQLGDVGQFQLTSLVQPRRVEQGGSVAVTIKITGSGNFPTSLRPPEKTGVEWLDPEKKESIEPQGDELTGFRSFGYVVRLTEPGAVDLGTIELPYWNPRAKRYEIAKSKLGTVNVTPKKDADPQPVPTATGQSAGPNKDDPFGSLPPPRLMLSPYSEPPGEQILPGYQFGAALLAPPFLALFGIFVVEVGRRARAKIASNKESPHTLAAEAMKSARAAKKAGDSAAAFAAVERAIVLSIEGASGVKARGVLKEELSAELVKNGVEERLAERAVELLSACDRARFDPLAAGEVSLDDAESLVSELSRLKAA